jgi:hypothetical protein
MRGFILGIFVLLKIRKFCFLENADSKIAVFRFEQKKEMTPLPPYNNSIGK